MTGHERRNGVQFDPSADEQFRASTCSHGLRLREFRSHLPGQRHSSVRTNQPVRLLSGCLAFLICCAWRLRPAQVQGMATALEKFCRSPHGMPRMRQSPPSVTDSELPSKTSAGHGNGLPRRCPRPRYWTQHHSALSSQRCSWTRRQTVYRHCHVCLFVAVVWKYSGRAFITSLRFQYVAGGLFLQIVRRSSHRVASSRDRCDSMSATRGTPVS